MPTPKAKTDGLKKFGSLIAINGPEGGTALMFKARKRLITALVAMSLLLIPCRFAAAQEGVLHMLLRSVVAIPEAVLHSLHGPVKTDNDENQGPRIRYPYPVHTNYGQSYGYAVPPDVLVHNSPGYVTYNVVREKPGKPQNAERETDAHVFGPIPFNE